jgi:hypothetical protein
MKQLAATARDLAGGKVTQETVQGVSADGRAQVAGHYTNLPPGARVVHAGETVPVAWEHGKPVLVLTNQAQRIQPVAPPVPVTVGAVLEALVIVQHPDTSRAVWFVNDQQALDLELDLGGKIPQQVGWGVSANGFWVLTDDRVYHVFAVKRAGKDVPFGTKKPPATKKDALVPWRSLATIVVVTTAGSGSGMLGTGYLDRSEVSTYEEFDTGWGAGSHTTWEATQTWTLDQVPYAWTESSSQPLALSQSYWTSRVRVQSVTLNEALDLVIAARFEMGNEWHSRTGAPAEPKVAPTQTCSGGIDTVPGTGLPSVAYGIQQEGHFGILNASRGTWLWKSWENTGLTLTEVADRWFTHYAIHLLRQHTNVTNPAASYTLNQCSASTVQSMTFAGSYAQFQSQIAAHAAHPTGEPLTVRSDFSRDIGKADLFRDAVLDGLDIDEDLLYAEQSSPQDIIRWTYNTVGTEDNVAIPAPAPGNPGSHTEDKHNVVLGIRLNTAGTEQARKRIVILDGHYVPGRGTAQKPRLGVLWVRVLLEQSPEWRPLNSVKRQWGLVHLDLDTERWTIVHPVAEVTGAGQSNFWLIGATETHVLYGFQQNPVAGFNPVTTPYAAEFFLAGIAPQDRRVVATATTYEQARQIIIKGLQLLKTDYTFSPTEQGKANEPSLNRMLNFWDFKEGTLRLKDLAAPYEVDDALPKPVTKLVDLAEALAKKQPGATIVQDAYPTQWTQFTAQILLGYAQPGPAYHVLQDKRILQPFSRYRTP